MVKKRRVAMSEGREGITDCSPEIILLVFPVEAVAITITGIGQTRATVTLLLFFANETLAGCIESVRDVHWWIAAETILGMSLGVLVVRQADGVTEGRSDEIEIRFAVK
jgi:hypothetical protein